MSPIRQIETSPMGESLTFGYYDGDQARWTYRDVIALPEPEIDLWIVAIFRRLVNDTIRRKLMETLL